MVIEIPVKMGTELKGGGMDILKTEGRRVHHSSGPPTLRPFD
jgi:hypothetical protein